MSSLLRFLVAMILIAVFATRVTAQTPSPVEITVTDLTKIEKSRSTHIALYGITLGDRADLAEERARSAGFRVEAGDNTVSGQVRGRLIRAFDSSNNEPFGFVTEDGTVTSLILRSALAPRLPGESSRLFDASIMEEASPLRLRLLGREDSRTVSRGVIPQVTISYDAEGIRLSSSIVNGRSLDPVIFLVPPAKAR